MRTRKRIKPPFNDGERDGWYRLITQYVKDIIFSVDMNLAFTYVSPSVKDVLGYSQEEILQSSITKITTPDSLIIIEDAFTEALQLEKTVGKEGYEASPLEVELICADGTKIWAEVSRTFIRDQDDNPKGVVGVVRDITRSKSIEHALRISEARYKNLITSMPEGVASTDLDENLTFVNDAFARMLGYSVDELLGMNLVDLIPEDEMTKLEEGNELRKEGVSSIYEIRVKKKDGEMKLLRVAAVPLYDENGTTVGSIAVTTDITDRKRYEEDLIESERKHRTLVESMHDIVFVYDEENRYADCFASSDTFLVESPEMFLGKHISDILPQEIATSMIDIMAEVRKSEEPTTFDYPLDIRGKKLWFSATFSLHEDGESVVAVVRDITKRHSAEEKLIASNRDLELYTSLLLHDIKNDLHVLMTSTEVAMMFSVDNPKVMEYLESARSSVERMRRMVEDVSKPSDLSDSTVPEMIRTVSDEAERTHIGLQVEIETKSLKKAPKIMGARLLPLVFINLLRNSAAYGGEEPKVKIVITKTKGRLVITYSDNGPGIPKEIQPRLFEKGTSTTGGGYGLYLSKKVLEGYGGSISLMRSAPKTGATFMIMLPLK